MTNINVGGYVADRWLGTFRTIVYCAVSYILGHTILGTFDSNVGLYVALTLLVGNVLAGFFSRIYSMTTPGTTLG